MFLVHHLHPFFGEWEILEINGKNAHISNKINIGHIWAINVDIIFMFGLQPVCNI